MIQKATSRGLSDREMEEFAYVNDAILNAPLVGPLAVSAMLLAGVTVLIVVAFVVRLPSYVSCSGQVTAASPPIEILPPSSGGVRWVKYAATSVESRLVDVGSGEVIAIVGSEEDAGVIASLKAIAKRVSGQPEMFGQLGELEAIDSSEMLGEAKKLAAAMVRYRRMQDLASELSASGEELVSKSRDSLGQSAKQLESQSEDLREAAGLLADLASRAEYLHGLESASRVEVSTARGLHIDKVVEAGKARLAIVAARSNFDSIVFRAKELELSYGRSVAEARVSVVESATGLYESCVAWEKRHLVVSPVAGRLLWADFLRVGSFAREDEPLATILPGGAALVAAATILNTPAGKLEGGCKSNIYLSDFPSGEYGYLNGELLEAPSIYGDGYAVHVQIPFPYVTSLGKALPLKQGMPCEIQIITDEATLFERATRRMSENFR